MVHTEKAANVEETPPAKEEIVPVVPGASTGCGGRGDGRSGARMRQDVSAGNTGVDALGWDLKKIRQICKENCKENCQVGQEAIVRCQIFSGAGFCMRYQSRADRKAGLSSMTSKEWERWFHMVWLYSGMGRVGIDLGIFRMQKRFAGGIAVVMAVGSNVKYSRVDSMTCPVKPVSHTIRPALTGLYAPNNAKQMRFLITVSPTGEWDDGQSIRSGRRPIGSLHAYLHSKQDLPDASLRQRPAMA
ncbi:hypothetical protein C8J56DRAFT_896161 [Mycena floridula]|nr:hypothetical protein C8J56DRAFT_896161 [Mycena floridula]